MDNTNNTVHEFTEKLIKALDEQCPKSINSFFTSRVWFFVAVFSVIVNIVMAGAVLWQHLRIDYLVTKLVGQ